MGITYYAKGYVRRAEPHWKRAAELDPKNRTCRMQLVKLYLDGGKPEKALLLCEQLLEIDPANAAFRMNLGFLYAQVNQIDAALAEVRRAIDLESISAGLALFDYDGDGDEDVYFLSGAPLRGMVVTTPPRNALYRNDGNHWLQIRLQGTKTNRDGVGARVKVVAGDLTQIDEVHSGHGYQSHFGMRLHFGLGKRDRVEVRWIGGGIDVLKNVAVDRVLTIKEGEHAEP